MSDTTSSTSGAREMQGVDPTEPQEDELESPLKRYFCKEPGGILCSDAEQPCLRILQQDIIVHHFERMEEPGLFVNAKMHVLLYKRRFDPIIQVGPSCGMVALAMLARMLGKKEVTTEKIVAHARKKGYTRFGELFSVPNARAIAEDALGANATVEEVSDNPWRVCQRLIDHAILFCYDSCGNRPTFQRGKCAHWALITGFALVYHEDLTPKQKEVFKSYKTRGKGDDVSERLALREALLTLKRHSQVPPTVYVLGRHGGSKEVFYFKWSTMVKSCRQLMEFDHQFSRAKCVLPREGLAAAMSGKFVRVWVPPEAAAFQVGSHAEIVKGVPL